MGGLFLGGLLSLTHIYASAQKTSSKFFLTRCFLFFRKASCCSTIQSSTFRFFWFFIDAVSDPTIFSVSHRLSFFFCSDLESHDKVIHNFIIIPLNQGDDLRLPFSDAHQHVDLQRTFSFHILICICTSRTGLPSVYVYI